MQYVRRDAVRIRFNQARSNYVRDLNYPRALYMHMCVCVIFVHPYSVIDVLSNSFVEPSSRRYDRRNKLFYMRTALGEFRVIRKRRAIEKYRHRLKTSYSLLAASVYGDTFFFRVWKKNGRVPGPPRRTGSVSTGRRWGKTPCEARR